MKIDRDMKITRMIVKNGLTSAIVVSAHEYGSTGVTKGIVDTQGYGRMRVEITKNKAIGEHTQTRLFFQSAKATLVASATAFSGYTSGRIQTSFTTSNVIHALDFNLNAFGNRKRYVNAALSMSGKNSCVIEVRAILYNGESFPPSTTGYTAITTVGHG